MNCIQRWLRWRRFVNKIEEKLPHYHPDTGQPLNWEIDVVFLNAKYDTQTGKRIKGWPRLSITQRSPGGILVDDRVYVYNHISKKIIQIPARWR